MCFNFDFLIQLLPQRDDQWVMFLWRKSWWPTDDVTMHYCVFGIINWCKNGKKMERLERYILGRQLSRMEALIQCNMYVLQCNFSMLYCSCGGCDIVGFSLYIITWLINDLKWKRFMLMVLSDLVLNSSVWDIAHTSWKPLDIPPFFSTATLPWAGWALGQDVRKHHHLLSATVIPTQPGKTIGLKYIDRKIG